MKTHQLTLSLLGILASIICFGTAAQAHDTWVSLDPYHVEKNTGTTAVVVSSHHFPAPAKDILAPERLEKVFFVTPASRQIASGTAFTENGTYLAVAIPVNGFATKTPDGYQRGKNKKEVDNAILCTSSLKFAKAVFTVGEAGGQAYSKPLGHAMEIIPLQDPAGLKTGDVLPVKVLMEGKPVRLFVFGTYSGFTESDNTFAYTTATDKEGIARIKIIHDGTWLLIAKHEIPYPDTAECDMQRWAATLTFKVK